jgi:hypothetical protein
MEMVVVLEQLVKELVAENLYIIAAHLPERFPDLEVEVQVRLVETERQQKQVMVEMVHSIQ